MTRDSAFPSIPEWDEFQSTRRAEKPHFYHYTDAHGLKGILEEDGFWATHVSYLNDASELTYAFDLVDRVIPEAIKRESLGLRPKLVDDLKSVRIEDYVFGDLRPFVACFCEDGDLLSQWRGYAKTASPAYSIGVNLMTDIDRIKPFNRARHTFNEPRKVIYCEDEQATWVEKTLKAWAKTWVDRDDPTRSALPNLATLLWEPCLCFKHPKFREEKEWRLIFQANIKVLQETHGQQEDKVLGFRYRAAAGFGLVPFVRLQPLTTKDSKLDIRCVRVGPCSHPDLAAESARHFLKSKGYSSIRAEDSTRDEWEDRPSRITKVYKSTIPLRP